ncbi:hypothetical protein BDZ90DRAFT_233163 [Jaminaea rosea]|uniref:Cyanovirin-N domain-containing protein n=1 Tax=Jaminaea rosea TaxID=1569628 RepID=A0A316UMP5_9BASI|nr:hypothetical protein BDZ90DRAFT_233163 [Jaminaea rosea]PWN26547.1 hypothetical protein BDZ90DRAFT_233163 [Jaminaea rosea]
MLSLLLALVIHSLTLPHSASAAHSICSWRPYTRSPAYSSLYLWCSAELTITEEGRGDYRCKVNTGIKIADFGGLRQGVLEWGEERSMWGTVVPCQELTFCRPSAGRAE